MADTYDKKMSQFDLVDTAHISDDDIIPLVSPSETNPAKKNKKTLVSSFLARVTGSMILQRLLTVDGPDSGLDADTLDGKQGSEYTASAELAREWATKTDGEVVDGEGYSAKKYAIDSEDSATSAGNSESIALAKAGIATTKASEALSSAQTATTKAGEASSSALSAAGSADTATLKATTASSARDEAIAAAETAVGLVAAAEKIPSAVSSSEIGYLDGVTSAIQAQLNAKVGRTSATGSAVTPSGTTAQRDSAPVEGYSRYNSTFKKREFWNGTIWVVDDSGPCFSAYASGANQSAASAVFTKVEINTEESNGDPDSCFDTANARFTPNVAGWYQIDGIVRILDPTRTLQQAIACIYKNGSIYTRGTDLSGSAGFLTTAQLMVSALIYLNGTTDYVELYGIVLGTSALFAKELLSATSRFTGFLARRA